MDTWGVWELVLPELESRHNVLALTLPGHAGGPPIDDTITSSAFVDAVEGAMGAAGFELAHLVGNSLGGYPAFRLAARGRAATVVAFAPAGGWGHGDRSYQDLLRAQRELQTQNEGGRPAGRSLRPTDGVAPRG